MAVSLDEEALSHCPVWRFPSVSRHVLRLTHADAAPYSWEYEDIWCVNQWNCPAISSFFVACASLFKYTDDLITVENYLRVIRMECPIKWLSCVDLHGFQQLNGKLSSWKIGLPKCLKWESTGSDLTIKHPLIRRMCILAHLRYLYFRLRQHRPFSILTLRLSQPCACELSPHITGKDVDSIDASLSQRGRTSWLNGRK